MLKKEQV